ncbi:MAG: class I SAM-dependent methyltransferase [Candidatus Babeliales bacterium]
MTVVPEKIKETSKKFWGHNPAGWTFGDGHQKGSKEFFDAVLDKRYTYECDWLDEIVQFKRLKNKKVLEIGFGGGYDAYLFCKNGAEYTGVDITAENKILAEQHLQYYDFKPSFLTMDAEKITWENEFDYIYSFGVLHHTPNMQQALNNCYKALKKEGEAQIIVYYKYSIFYMLSVVLNEWILRGGFRKRSLKEQRSLIEYTQSTEKPLVNVYSKKQLHKMLKNAGFKIIKTDIRKLVHEDLPGIRFIGRLRKYMPQTILNKLSKYFGWYLSVRAIKE